MAETVVSNEFVLAHKVNTLLESLPALPTNTSSVYWLLGSREGQLHAGMDSPDRLSTENFDLGGGPSFRVSLLTSIKPASTQSLIKKNESETQTPVGVGTRLLYTDENVNVWEFFIPPGDCCHYHKHTLPYFYINLTESLTQELDAEGNVAAPPRLQKLDQTTFVPKDKLGQHAVVNLGDQPFLQFIVELKKCI